MRQPRVLPSPSSSSCRSCRELSVGRRRVEPRLDRLEARRKRIGDCHEPAFLRQLERERHLHQIARLERGRRLADLIVLADARVAAFDAEAVVHAVVDRRIDRVAQARGVEQRARALTREAQVVLRAGRRLRCSVPSSGCRARPPSRSGRANFSRASSFGPIVTTPVKSGISLSYFR